MTAAVAILVVALVFGFWAWLHFRATPAPPPARTAPARAIEHGMDASDVPRVPDRADPLRDPTGPAHR